VCTAGNDDGGGGDDNEQLSHHLCISSRPTDIQQMLQDREATKWI